MFLFKEIPIEDREKMIAEKAVKRETRNYSRSLENSEIALEEKRHTQDAIDIDEIKEKAKNAASAYKVEIDNLETKMKERREIVKSGKRTVTGVLYAIPDHPNKRMLMYDKFGELIDSRDMLPEERQGTLFVGAPKDSKDLEFKSNTNADAMAENARKNKPKGNVKAHGEYFEAGGTSNVSADPMADALMINELAKKVKWKQPRQIKKLHQRNNLQTGCRFNACIL